ncbi:grpE protein homolog, mitochondrial [Toxorhynchites rutilus septentrionalis]|uniref:grpE protein homolog, mitochondrial n=1 Tax=Toxorhynchites rutilus septentrionalis TaxID=329112 RepID=UPI00247AFDBF|nr:grpE protein homolog, mitochondrial [Toxorhynchites rutilus septentrionalis]
MTSLITRISKQAFIATKHFNRSRVAIHLPISSVRSFSNEEAANKEAELSEHEKKLTVEVDSLKTEVETLNGKAKELDDKYKRALADGENLRRRLTKQIEDAKLFGIQGFCKDLLEVADILGHATEAVPKEEISDKNPHLKNLFEGLTMTKAQLNQVFKRHGLEQVNPLNEKFNPNLHEALFQQEVQNVEPNTVVVVSKIGYKLHERCIRPALVGVSRG